MSKNQCRRTISLSAAAYVRLRTYCRANDISMSGTLETLVTTWLDEMGSPTVDPADAKREIRAGIKPPPSASGIWTF